MKNNNKWNSTVFVKAFCWSDYVKPTNYDAEMPGIVHELVHAALLDVSLDDIHQDGATYWIIDEAIRSSCNEDVPSMEALEIEHSAVWLQVMKKMGWFKTRTFHIDSVAHNFEFLDGKHETSKQRIARISKAIKVVEQDKLKIQEQVDKVINTVEQWFEKIDKPEPKDDNF